MQIAVCAGIIIFVARRHETSTLEWLAECCINAVAGYIIGDTLARIKNGRP